MPPSVIALHGRGVTLDDVEAVARRGAKVALGDGARERLIAARAVVERVAQSGKRVYGLTTALGANTGAPIAAKDLAAYQRRSIAARAVGVAPPLATDVVRAIMFTRASAMAVGGSGISPSVLDALLALLNGGVHPIVPQRGSIGAADLAPLAHIALVLLGEGCAEVAATQLDGREALARAGLAPATLTGKDGLALISSNARSVGHAALVLVDAACALDRVNLAVALTHEAFRANVTPLDPRVHAARGAPGQTAIAARLSDLLDRSALHQAGSARRVQDPISLRCVTQVHGAVWTLLRNAQTIVERELNAASDSPLVVAADDDMLSNGNFDTTELAIAFEALGLALAHAGAMSVQRCQRLFSPATSGLPLQLTRRGPEHSGFATLQKTLIALASELRHLAQPVTLGAGPASESIEDHAALAPQVVAKTAAMLPVLDYIAAIELMSAAQAVDLCGLGPDALGSGVRATYAAVRSTVDMLDEDRPLGRDVDALVASFRGPEWPLVRLLA